MGENKRNRRRENSWKKERQRLGNWAERGENWVEQEGRVRDKERPKEEA